MNILLTGATGYIGQRLLPALLEQGYTVYCCVRDEKRFDRKKYNSDNIHIIRVDFLDIHSLDAIPTDIDAAYYLLHSMSNAYSNFEDLEKQSAENFCSTIEKTKVTQVIYLGGIVNEKNLSKHLASRKSVEDILASSSFSLTTLRAGIIVGSGSASFEIIRDLVEKLPVMVAPKWLQTKSQPIAISNVIEFLKGVLLVEAYYNKTFDIGGPDVLTYEEMLLQFAKVRNLKRKIYTVPVMTPKLSSYWLYFVTSTSFSLARNLVDSMKINVICKPNDLASRLGISLLTYKDAVSKAFYSQKHNQVLSSWKDAHNSKSYSQT